MMTLSDKRRAIRSLLENDNPADALACYYAFHHPDDKTRLVIYPQESQRASGYVCVSRTGMDLFRPVVTLRLPQSPTGQEYDIAASALMIQQAIRDGTQAIMIAPETYRPILTALFDIQSEKTYTLMVLDRGRFEPIINVLVTRGEGYNNLPRFAARSTQQNSGAESGDVLASAGVNWQSDRYAEIYVHTKAPFRRQGLGKSVVAALVNELLNKGVVPLYLVAQDNPTSIRLAESVGFVSLGIKKILIEGILRHRS